MPAREKAWSKQRDSQSNLNGNRVHNLQIVDTIRNDTVGLLVESKMFSYKAYDGEKSSLYLRFRSGDVYRYFDFTEEQCREFLAAESLGRYFLRHIRVQFRCERLAKLQAA